MAVEYNRLLSVESQIEKTVLKRIESEGGIFLPPDIVKGRHVYFAIDYFTCSGCLCSRCYPTLYIFS